MNASAPAAPPPSFHPRLLLFAALLCLTCGSLLAQTASPDYTNDLPSVERVKAEIKGSDATDSLARQVAVFTYLYTYVDRIKLNRDYRGPYTPGETRVMTAYRLAAYQMSQDYAKNHTPAEAAAFERLHGQYEMNSDFYKDWSKRLIGPQSAAAYKGAEAGLAATQQAHVDSIKRANEEAQAQSQAHTTNAQGLSNDPTAVATRRCLELGGSNTGCMGKGFMSGFMDLVGFGDKAQESFMGSGRAGVVLSGLYKNPATTTSLGFNEGSVAINGCGKLVADGHNYTIDKRPGSLQVTVENEPHPIMLTMRPDGGLTGPGLIEVKGRIISGYHTVTTTQMINGYRAAPDQCNGPCQTVSTVPDYSPAMARCTIGSLAMPPAPKPAPAGAQPADNSGIMGLVTGLGDMLSPGGSASFDGGGGLRMAGKYGGGMLLLDFSGNSLVLDCGQAHIRTTYAVENTPGTFLVHVQNPSRPFTLAVQPDNSLRGAGSTTVNGKLVTGMAGENITFAPHSENCDVGTFRPKTGAAPASSVATASPAPAPIATAAGASVVPVSSASTDTTGGPATGGMTLAISSSFPTAANPLAGRVVQLMSERYDIALRKVGAPISADITPGKALVAYMANCGPPKSCPAYATAMHPYFVGKATFDSSGKATVTANVPPGSYYVFSAASGTSGALIWDLPITLKAGDNTITLTATNAELVH
jgi:hypothetical protein